MPQVICGIKSQGLARFHQPFVPLFLTVESPGERNMQVGVLRIQEDCRAVLNLGVRVTFLLKEFRAARRVLPHLGLSGLRHRINAYGLHHLGGFQRTD